MGRRSRAVLLVGGAGLIAAWLAAAADWQPVAVPASQPEGSSMLARTEQVLADIQSQSVRLRRRLAVAPQPGPSLRNPFAFHERAEAESRPARVRAASIDAPVVLSEPELPPITLSGIAEESPADESAAPTRIAVIAGYGDVFLVKTGETIAARYQVTAIGADAVEIADLITGRTFRLGLR